LLEHTGIKLSDSKQAMVCRRLNRRLHRLGLADFAAYVQLLYRDEAELQHAVDALTTNLTGFFREPHHFELLSRELAEHRRGPVLLWSAGCSTGQEAYSLVMLAAESRPLAEISVLATDINAAVLETARAGVYTLEEVLPLGQERLQRFFLKGRGDQLGKARVKPEIAERVRFGQANLHDPWTVRGPFDAIFCRNVLIYFQKEAQEALLERFWRALVPGGLLCLGHSESVLNSRRYHWLGQTAYRRRE